MSEPAHNRMKMKIEALKLKRARKPARRTFFNVSAEEFHARQQAAQGVMAVQQATLDCVTKPTDSNKSDVQKYVVQVNAKFEAEIANLTNQLKVKQIDLKVKQIDMKNSKRQLKVKRMEFKEFKNRGKILLATFA